MDEQLENLLQLQDKGDEVVLSDFVNKRAQLFNDLLRQLSAQCAFRCQEYANEQTEVKEIDGKKEVKIPDISSLEQQCQAKCEAKVVLINKRLERHLDDIFTPQIAQQFL